MDLALYFEITHLKASLRIRSVNAISFFGAPRFQMIETENAVEIFKCVCLNVVNASVARHGDTPQWRGLLQYQNQKSNMLWFYSRPFLYVCDRSHAPASPQHTTHYVCLSSLSRLNTPDFTECVYRSEFLEVKSHRNIVTDLCFETHDNWNARTLKTENYAQHKWMK